MRKVVRIEVATDGTDRRHRGFGIWVYLPSRMLRAYGSAGEAPGSHTGFWRTRMPADGLYGWNYRAGSLRRNVTVLAHTKRITPSPSPAGEPG